jgi:hypothetical protein
MEQWVCIADSMAGQESNSNSKNLHNPTGRHPLYMSSAGL